MWFNEYEVSDVAGRYRQHPVLGPATQTLLNLVNWTNSNSDGWAYWRKPGEASQALQRLISNHDKWERGEYQRPRPGAEATPQALKTALRTLKGFRTRHSADFVIVEEPTVSDVSLPEESSSEVTIQTTLLITFDVADYCTAYGFVPEEACLDSLTHLPATVLAAANEALERLGVGAKAVRR